MYSFNLASHSWALLEYLMELVRHSKILRYPVSTTSKLITSSANTANLRIYDEFSQKALHNASKDNNPTCYIKAIKAPEILV